MPDSLLLHLNFSAMLTAQMGMATLAQYRRQVPSRSTTVQTLATGLRGRVETRQLTWAHFLGLT